MTRWFAVVSLFVAVIAAPAQQANSCRVIHGRAHSYGGDGNLRIWEIGTHHEFKPDAKSWGRVLDWIDAGVTPEMKRTSAVPDSLVDLFGDFLICPTEPFRQGALKEAVFKSVQHRRYVPSQ